MVQITLTVDAETAARFFSFLNAEQQALLSMDVVRARPRAGASLQPASSTVIVPPSVHANTIAMRSDGRRGRSTGYFYFRAFGVAGAARTAEAAMIEILRRIIDSNPNVMPKLAQAVRGRTRNHIATAPERVYPHRPDLTGCVVELVPGWYIGTNISNPEKLRILNAACEVAGLLLGVDIVIDLPNTRG